MENVQKEKSLKEQQSVSKPIKKICFEMLLLKQKEQEVKNQYSKLQAKLKEHFAKIGESNLWFSENGKKYNITDVNPTKIIWDADKLKQRLPADVSKQVITTAYGISDWSGFCNLLKKNGIKPNSVVPFLTIDRKVNQKKIDELSEIGEITPEDIEGCFTTEKMSGYIKLSEKEEAGDEE